MMTLQLISSPARALKAINAQLALLDARFPKVDAGLIRIKKAGNLNQTANEVGDYFYGWRGTSYWVMAQWKGGNFADDTTFSILNSLDF